MSTAAEQSALLPEHLRVPDLSTVQDITAQDLRTWDQQAKEALRWGPDRRNGCIRVGADWHDEKTGRFRSPDPWTPAYRLTDGNYWCDQGEVHRVDDQPAVVGPKAVAWYRQGVPHRAHAPARLSPTTTDWYWDGKITRNETAMLLDDAWENTLTDERARALLLMAETRTSRVTVSAQQWVALAIAENPSEAISAQIRSWCALLAP